jgi:hypothetical protein
MAVTVTEVGGTLSPAFTNGVAVAGITATELVIGSYICDQPQHVTSASFIQKDIHKMQKRPTLTLTISCPLDAS